MRIYNLMGEGGSKILKDSTSLTYDDGPFVGIVALDTTEITAVVSNVEGLEGEILEKGDPFYGRFESITIASGGKLQIIKKVP